MASKIWIALKVIWITREHGLKLRNGIDMSAQKRQSDGATCLIVHIARC